MDSNEIIPVRKIAGSIEEDGVLVWAATAKP